jgi:E3 ubiquitin-protein ligase HERC2
VFTVIIINQTLWFQISSAALVQDVLGFGWLNWDNTGHTSGPSTLHNLVELGVNQICCSERCVLVLTRAGKVYMHPYSSEGQVLYM